MSKRYNEGELLSITTQQFMDFITPVAQKIKQGVFCSTCGGDSFEQPSLVRAKLTSNQSAPVDYFSLSCSQCGEVKFYNAQLIAGSILK